MDSSGLKVSDFSLASTNVGRRSRWCFAIACWMTRGLLKIWMWVGRRSLWGEVLVDAVAFDALGWQPGVFLYDQDLHVGFIDPLGAEVIERGKGQPGDQPEDDPPPAPPHEPPELKERAVIAGAAGVLGLGGGGLRTAILH